MEKLLNKYLNFFKKLRRAHNKHIGKAPHKPILLISLAQLIRGNVITSNKVFITPELVLAFKSNWNNLVETNHIPNFSLPFFHLKSEPFWNLVSKPGMQLAITKSKSVKSFKNLNDTIAFAEIDKELFMLLKDKETSLILEQFLLTHYFNIIDFSILSPKTSQLQINIENDILNDDKVVYKSKIKELQATLDDESFQEEIFVRGGIFKKTIPKIYHHQCCISEMKIESTSNAQMVDAFHKMTQFQMELVCLLTCTELMTEA